MDGYDLDDTLAATEFANAATRGLVNVFKSAKVIYKPQSPFVVITARSHSTQAERRATTEWLRENQPNYRAIYYCEGSETDVAKRKADLIKRLNLKSFTDNNSDILGQIADQTEGVRLYKMSRGTRVPFTK